MDRIGAPVRSKRPSISSSSVITLIVEIERIEQRSAISRIDGEYPYLSRYSTMAL